MLEKDFYQLSELVERWECTVQDLLHLGIQDNAQICTNLYGYDSEQRRTRLFDGRDGLQEIESETETGKTDKEEFEKWKSRTTRDMPNGIFEITYESLRFLEMPGDKPVELYEALKFDGGWWNVEFLPPAIIRLENLCMLREEVERLDCELLSISQTKKHLTIDTPQGHTNLAEAFSNQLDALFNTYIDIAESLKVDTTNVDKLCRIGYWQRIVLLDRTEGGDLFLNEKDCTALLGLPPNYLSDVQESIEWSKAGLNEQWVAFGIHVYTRIISGEVGSDEEAVYLFRLASEMLTYFGGGGIGENRAKSITENAKAAANVRHSMAGGSREKQQLIRRAWASGKYSSRDICAEQECAALGMSFSTARKALRGTPDPV